MWLTQQMCLTREKISYRKEICATPFSHTLFQSPHHDSPQLYIMATYNPSLSAADADSQLPQEQYLPVQIFESQGGYQQVRFSNSRGGLERSYDICNNTPNNKLSCRAPSHYLHSGCAGFRGRDSYILSRLAMKSTC